MKTDPPAADPKREKQRAQNMGWYGLIAILSLGLVWSWNHEQQGTTYAKFKADVRADHVERVVIGPEAIHVFLKKDQADPARAPQYAVPRGGIDDKNLVPLLEEKKVDFNGESPSLLAEALVWLLPVALVVAAWVYLMRRMGQGPEAVLSLGKSKAKIYGDPDVKTTFKDVAGVDEAVEEVREIVEFLKNPEKFKRLGASIPKGILLVGLPGTGKTLLARALAGEAKVPFFHLSGSDFVEMFAGLGAARVRDLFKQAKEKAPCIVFIDELDALGKIRTMSSISGHEEREQTLNALLVELDGFEQNSGVVLIGATNRPEMLDPALLRPGRFDRQVVVDRPDQAGREAVLKVHAKDKKLSAALDLKIVAQRTVGMVGADLANVLNEAALLAGRKGREEILMADVDEAIDRVLAGLEKKKRVISPKEREVIAYHEAGHALLAMLLPGVDKVHKVSIIPRGVAALGVTIFRPTEERYVVRKSELEDQLAVGLGGRAAEEIAFGEMSTGAASDFEHATDLARRMVTEFGMSEKLGLASHEGGRRPQFLDLPGDGARRYSEETAREIDLEVKRILEEQHARAKETLLESRAALDRIAKRLLEIEVIDREEIDRIVKETPAVA